MPNFDALATELNRLLATETHSVSRHIELEATPYTDAATYKVWRDLKHFKAESDDHARRLSQLLAEHDLSDVPGNFPQLAAFLHYVDIKTLLPLLIDEKRQQLAAYERAVSHAADEPSLQSALNDLLGENREQLDRLVAHRAALAGDAQSQPA